MPSMREHEFEIIAHYSGNKVLGTVWWDPDSQKIEASSPSVLNRLKKATKGGIAFSNSTSFLEHLPEIFSNGYVSARRVKKHE